MDLAIVFKLLLTSLPVLALFEAALLTFQGNSNNMVHIGKRAIENGNCCIFEMLLYTAAVHAYKSVVKRLLALVLVFDGQVVNVTYLPDIIESILDVKDLDHEVYDVLKTYLQTLKDGGEHAAYFDRFENLKRIRYY